MVKRRTFIKAGAALAVSSGFGTFSLLKNNEPEVVDLFIKPADYLIHLQTAKSFSNSKELQIALQSCDRFIRSASSGRVAISFEKIDSLASLGAARHVTAFVGSPSLVPFKDPSMIYFSRLPQGLRVDQKKAWLTSEVGSEFWTKAYAGLKIKPLYFGQGPAADYQALSSPADDAQLANNTFLTKNISCLRAKYFLAPVTKISSYAEILQFKSEPFVTDALPIGFILDNFSALNRNLQLVSSEFLSSSVFSLNFQADAWNQMPQDIRSLLTDMAIHAGDLLTALLQKRAEEVNSKLNLVKNSAWHAEDRKKSLLAYENLIYASRSSAEIFTHYESFRNTRATLNKA